MDYEIDFLISLFFTISVELIVLVALAKTVYKKNNQPLWLLILTGFIASMATLPYFWFVLPLFIHTKLYYRLTSEILAVIIETFIIYGFLRLDIKKALLISAICNLFSYFTGLLINLPLGH
jgi:hypothetical protein